MTLLRAVPKGMAITRKNLSKFVKKGIRAGEPEATLIVSIMSCTPHAGKRNSPIS